MGFSHDVLIIEHLGEVPLWVIIKPHCHHKQTRFSADVSNFKSIKSEHDLFNLQGLMCKYVSKQIYHNLSWVFVGVGRLKRDYPKDKCFISEQKPSRPHCLLTTNKDGMG